MNLSNQGEEALIIRLGLLLLGEDYYASTVLPLGLGYLSSFLADRLGFKDIFLEIGDPRKILDKNPDIIGISSFTETFEDVIRHTAWLKQQAPEIPIIVGGEHISAMPQSLPNTVDYGVIGEGEETLTELLDLYLRQKVTPDHLSKINGLIFRHQGKLVVTQPRAWIMELDTIPLPDRQLLCETNQQWDQAIFTARGCPYKCTFCASTTFWQRTRYHSVPRVVTEIEYIQTHFPQQSMITINDDLFPLNKKRVREISQAIRDKGLHRKVGFTCNARSNVFDDEIAQMLVSMNVVGVSFGFESASDRILRYLKGKTSAAYNQRALDICDKYGLMVVGNFMIGSAEETPVDMAKTYWFIQRNRERLWRPNICFATPFPGTEFWREAEERQLITEDFKRFNDLDLSFKPGCSVYMNRHVAEDEFTAIYDTFIRHPVLRHSRTPQELDTHFVQFHSKREYFRSLYQRLAQQVDLQNCLEISGEHFSITQWLESSRPSCERALVVNGEVNLPPLKQYPLIVLTHALERLHHPVALLQQLSDRLTEQGQLVCIFYNAQHPSFLLSLLQGKWQPTVFGINQHSHLQFFSMPTLLRLFTRLGWKPQVAEQLKHEQDEKTMALTKPLLKLLEGHMDVGTFCRNSPAIGFVLLLEPVLQQRAEPAFTLPIVEV